MKAILSVPASMPLTELAHTATEGITLTKTLEFAPLFLRSAKPVIVLATVSLVGLAPTFPTETVWFQEVQVQVQVQAQIHHLQLILSVPTMLRRIALPAIQAIIWIQSLGNALLFLQYVKPVIVWAIASVAGLASAFPMETVWFQEDQAQAQARIYHLQLILNALTMLHQTVLPAIQAIIWIQSLGHAPLFLQYVKPVIVWAIASVAGLAIAFPMEIVWLDLHSTTFYKCFPYRSKNCKYFLKSIILENFVV